MNLIVALNMILRIDNQIKNFSTEKKMHATLFKCIREGGAFIQFLMVEKYEMQIFGAMLF